MNRSSFILFIFLIGLTKINKTQAKNSGSIYSKVNDKNNIILNSSFLITSFDSNSKHKCLASCTKNLQCFYAVYQQSKCFICRMNMISYANYATNGNSLIYYKKSYKPTNGLTNYWTFNENVNDEIGNAHLFGAVNVSLTVDRYGRPNSALSLSNGYYKVPEGAYFSATQLSIMGWVKVRNIRSFSRLVDFGFLSSGELVVFSLSESTSGKPFIHFLTAGKEIKGVSSVSLNLNEWKHLACVFSFPYYSIYIDGVETTPQGSQSNLASFSLPLNRPSNFVGRSNYFQYDQDSDADFDDLKLFNRALTITEIQYEMNNNL
jgi:hypothetical protein